MNRLFIAIALIFSAFIVNAQALVQGRVVDATKKTPVGYATVALLRDTIVVKAVAARADGNFSLETKEQGKILLEISSVGYATIKKPIEVSGGSLNVGDVAISEGVVVDAVAVTVQKPIVTADAEKMTYSVEDDPEASSSTLEEIIRKVPQLSIDSEGNVLMNGQKDYKVLVNGHTSSSMSRNFADVIKSMPASSIKRIEVITNPSMKYDAEGAGGVLNIVTTKSRFDGYNGRINLGVKNTFNRNFHTGNSAQFTLQTKKFSLSTSLYYSQAWDTIEPSGFHCATTESFVEGSPYKTMVSNMKYGYDFTSLYGSVNASYQIDESNLLTAELGVWGGKSFSKMHSAEYLYYDDAGDLLYGYNSPLESPSKWFGVDASVNYQHSFGRDDHTLTISDNISIMPPMQSHMLQESFDIATNTLLSMIDSYTIEDALTNVLQVDYNNTIGEKHNIEAGTKYTLDYTGLDNREVFGGATPSETYGITKQNRHILGLYAGYAFTTEKFSTRFGARLEGAWYSTDYKGSGVSEVYSYPLINCVPYISFTYNPNMGHMLSLSYNERLSRPSINAMSPFVKESVTMLHYGNPNLRTGITHNFRLKYAYTHNKLSVSAELSAAISNNLVSTYKFVDKQGLINETYKNDGRLRVYGLLTTLSYRPSSKFNMSVSVNGGYVERSMPSENISAKGFTMSQNLSMTIALWKGARLTLSEYLIRQEPTMGTVSDSWVVGTSARLGQRFLKNKLEVSVVVYNPHEKTSKYRSITETPTYISKYTDEIISRSIRFAVSYRFGKSGLFVQSTNYKYDDDGDTIGGSSKGGSGM